MNPNDPNVSLLERAAEQLGEMLLEQLSTWPGCPWQAQRHHLHRLAPSTSPWIITRASTNPNCLWRNAPGRVPTT